MGPSRDEWLAAFRRAVEAQREIFAEHVGIEARTEYEGVGEGGDNTLVIDRLCEDAIFAELEGLHEAGHEFTAVSEERGTVSFGSPDAPLRVVIDPIDGSLNARRTIPCHSLSIAVAAGDSMADVRLGYVYEFGAGEEFVASAVRERPWTAARSARRRVTGSRSSDSRRPSPSGCWPPRRASPGMPTGCASPGSIAVSLCYVAAGRFDGMISTRHCRSVDAAAGQLIVRRGRGTGSSSPGSSSPRRPSTSPPATTSPPRARPPT